MPSIFVTGPVRSGKSRFAEELARERGSGVLYVATARRDPDDPEWTARIAHHAARRPASWQTVETAAPNAPSLEAILREASSAHTLIVDSFGTWVAALMSPDCDEALLERAALSAVDALVETSALAIVVGEEVGWGLVPASRAGRMFRDVMGRAQARLARESVEAHLVVAGFAIPLHRVGRSLASL